MTKRQIEILKKLLLERQQEILQELGASNDDINKLQRENSADWVDRVSLHNEQLRELMKIKIYVDTDADIRLIRRLQRDLHERGRYIKAILEQYEKTVRPMHLQFVEPSKRYADIIIPQGGKNFVAIDLLKTKIESILSE